MSHDESADATAAATKQFRPRYSLCTLLALTLVCALFFGFVAIWVERQKDQWTREQEVIARLKRQEGIRRLVVESQQPKWAHDMLPKAYHKYFDRVTEIMVINGPQFSHAELDCLKVFSHLQDLQISPCQRIPPVQPSLPDDAWETFFQEMPVLYRTSKQQMQFVLDEKPVRLPYSFLGPHSPSNFIAWLRDRYDVAFFRLAPELKTGKMLVVYDQGLSLKDNFGASLGEQMDYRISPPWMWLIGKSSIAQAPVVAADDSSGKQRDLPPFDEEQAASRMQELGCTFRVDGQRPDMPIVMILATSGQFTDEDLARLRGLTELQQLALRKTSVTDNGLEHLKRFPKLEGLSIATPFVTDAGIVHLEGLLSLKILEIKGPQFGNAAVMHIKGLNDLETLSLAGTRIDGEGMESLRQLTQLQSLNLSRCELADEDLQHIAGLTELRSLNLGGVNLSEVKLNGPGLVYLAGLTELRELDLSWAGLKGPELVHLRGMAKLEELSLKYVRLDDASFAHLSLLKNLRILRLWHTGVTNAGLEHLKGLANLEELDVGLTEVTGRGLVHLLQMPRLRKLRLLGTSITDEDVDTLKAIKELEELDLKDTHVTADAVGRLESELPGCRIRH